MENIEKEEELLIAPELYEVSFLVVPTVGSEEAEEKANSIKEAISKEGGTILFEGKPKIIQLAYPMAQVVSSKRQMHESAYFGWVRFKVLSSEIETIKTTLHNDTSIIRFLILKTKKEVRETKRINPKKLTIKKEDPIEGEGKEVDEAELDKELKELLTT